MQPQPMAPWLPWAALLAGFPAGLALNRLIWILTTEGAGGLLAGGHCQRCGAALPWQAFIPLLGWVIPHARPPCGHRLAGWHGWGLALAWGGLALPALAATDGYEYSQSVLLLCLLYPLAMIDWLTMGVETRLVLAGILGRFASLLLFRPAQAAEMALGMATGAGIMALAGAFYHAVRGRQGLGEGDAAAMGLIGSFVGWQGVVPVVTAAAAGGLLGGSIWLWAGRRPLATPIPFVPFLCAGGMVVYVLQLLWGADWRDWL